LPGERRQLRIALVNPAGGIGLDGADEIRHGRLPAHRHEQMDVVRHPAGGDKNPLVFTKDAAAEGIQRALKSLVNQRLTILRAEDDMAIQRGQGLGHGTSPIPPPWRITLHPMGHDFAPSSLPLTSTSSTCLS